MNTSNDAFQDHYPDDVAHCYGCGYLNEHGLQIKSRWEGEDSVCRLTPQPYHTAFPGYVYGGLIASVIDCHSVGTAAAAWMKANGKEIGANMTERFVTGSLKIDYVRPTPLGGEIEVRARATEVGERKVIVEAELIAGGEVCVRGLTVAVKMPDGLRESSRRSRGA